VVEELRNFIGGQWTDTAFDKRAELVNPSTGEAFATAPVSGAAEVDAAISSAAEAFDGWRDATPGERSLALLRIADAIEARADEFVAAESRNTGKPIALTTSEEIPPMVDQIRFFAGAARMLEGRSAGEYMSGFTSFIRREPVGVCAAVTPWNYPMMMAVWKWAPALAAGNTMVLKPSDTTPVSTLLMAETMAEFLPPGVFNVICGDRDTGRALVAHPVPQMVSITGSVRAGKEVAGAAAAGLKRVHLELGGKAPVIVFDDADPEKAAEAIAIAGYFNAGQDCTAATRVLAGPRVHDDFVSALAEQAKAQTVGGPDVLDADFGPLNNASQLDRVAGFIGRLPDHARVVTGGKRTGPRGFFFEASVVDALQQDDETVQNEVFGPVITVQQFSDEEEGAALGQRHRLRAGLSVWTSDHGRAMRMARRLDFRLRLDQHAHPAGRRDAARRLQEPGYGKDLSMYGFEDYTRVKHVMSSWTEPLTSSLRFTGAGPMDVHTGCGAGAYRCAHPSARRGQALPRPSPPQLVECDVQQHLTGPLSHPPVAVRAGQRSGRPAGVKTALSPRVGDCPAMMFSVRAAARAGPRRLAVVDA
jgi:betaine-aldehyde dehydrogenase